MDVPNGNGGVRHAKQHAFEVVQGSSGRTRRRVVFDHDVSVSNGIDDADSDSDVSDSNNEENDNVSDIDEIVE